MTSQQNDGLGVIVLAAGLGKRMKSTLPKVLHSLCGRPMLSYVLDLAKAMGPKRIVVVAGKQGSEVEYTCRNEPIQVAHQTEQLGTAHAVLVARGHFSDFEGDLLILSGDVPLLKLETLKSLTSYHKAEGAEATVLTVILNEPQGYGRIVRENGEVIGIVEERDASEEQRSVKEINTGIYVFDSSILWTTLSEIEPNNVQGEYYLTDTIAVIRKGGGSVRGFPAPDQEETMGINTRESLADARRVIQTRIHRNHMLSGITIVDPVTTEIDWEVKIGRDTVVRPFTVLKGKTEIDEQCDIGPHAVIVDSKIGKGSRVGPFTRLRGCELPAEKRGL